MERWYTARQIAEIIGMSTRYVQREAQLGHLRSRALGGGRFRLSYRTWRSHMSATTPRTHPAASMTRPSTGSSRTASSESTRASTIWSGSSAPSALYTGMRLGEARGLTWDRVGFNEHRIVVTIAAAMVAAPAGSGKLTTAGFDAPKTRRSRREVPLSEEAERLLWSRYQRMGRPKVGLVFPGSDLTMPVSGSKVLRDLQKRLGAAEERFPIPDLHTLRHAFASLMIASGVPIPTVSKVLGHADPSITYRLYSHVLTDADYEAVQVMSFFPKGASPVKNGRATEAASLPERFRRNKPRGR